MPKPTLAHSSSSSPAPGTYSNPTVSLPIRVARGTSSPPTHFEAETQMIGVNGSEVGIWGGEVVAGWMKNGRRGLVSLGNGRVDVWG